MIIMLLTLVLGIQSPMAEGNIPEDDSLTFIEGDIDDETLDALGCDPVIMEAARKFGDCETFILGRNCSRRDLRMCIRMARRGEFDRKDEEHCVGCTNKTNWGEVIVGSLGMVAGPLAHYFTNRQWAKAQRHVGEARWNAFGQYANALKEFPQACIKGFNSYLDHRAQLGINGALSVDGAGSFFDQCSHLSQYAGFQGLFANGFGGQGNAWLGGGYSPGFLSGMLGPGFAGGGIMGYPGTGFRHYGIGGGYPGIRGGISIGGGIGMGGGFPGLFPGTYPGMGGGFPGIGGGIGMGGGFPGIGGGIGMGGGFPGIGGGIGMGGGFPGIGGGFPYPGIGGGISIGGGIGMGGGFPGIGGGIGMGGGFPGIGGGFPYPGIGGGISIGGGIGMGGGFPGIGGGGIIACIQMPCPGAPGGGIYPNYHMGIPGYNPNGHWGGSVGLNPWMNGGGGYFYGTGGWGNHTGNWNNRYNQSPFGPYGRPGGGQQNFYHQQQLQADQHNAVRTRMGIAAQTQSFQSRGLYENYYSAGADYYNNLAGGAHGGVPYGPRGLQCFSGFCHP